MTGTNGSNGNGAKVGTDKVKQGLAQMLKGGVIVSFPLSCIKPTKDCDVGYVFIWIVFLCHVGWL